MPSVKPSSSLRDSPVANSALLQRAVKAEQEVATLKRHLEFETDRKVECERAAYLLTRNFKIEVNNNIYFCFIFFILH